MLSMRKTFLGLVAVAIVLSTSTEAYVVSSAHVAEHITKNLQGFSVQCGQDLGRVYADKSVLALIGKLAQDAAGEAQMISDTCGATAFSCITAFGAGSCCTFEGPTMWAKHLGDLTALQQVGERVAPGYVAVGSVVLTINVAASGTIVSLAESFMNPFFVPKTCVNKDDALALNLYSSAACQKQPMPGITVLNCGVEWS
ncbi:hypothetical protein HOP50_03g22810 [Chloropicon primus]|uniref:Pherophorin domain-containing protein n=1 Tax=Chloropicon primus TaxID=1764295 RepID=A0A5B8MI76_9CHLO|nr:hypothetical protein A3770_03p22820 [Chloropicon primus]UPQ98975.1 hypothetical protein HOP50_03g22810 [Chloropicon primus]|eukprot:QDZ19764.1 hypothetical protein A3770_03p22820 [Chloropicon primus]